LVQTSVIIATHTRPASLARLLRSLAPQLVPERHELFVAENGTPEPAQIDGTGVNPIHLHDPRPGKCRIQNRAIALAGGEIIVCLDDDLVVASDYVAQVEQFFRDHPEYAAMKGRILPAEDPVSKAGEMAPYLDLPIVDHGEKVLEVRGVLGANMAFRAAALRVVEVARAETFMMAGGDPRPITTGETPVPLIFDERLGPGAAGHEEETEISRRLRAAGFRIGYAPRALVWHEVDSARAGRARFIRVARERGYCRILHEHHSGKRVAFNIAIASIRLAVAHALSASVQRVAREERRLAVAQGMRDGLEDAARKKIVGQASLPVDDARASSHAQPPWL
jgi:GT2 family glycosyltransferase